ncbi:EamA family transporter [Oscillatoria sp. FACHB-1407]|uniref:EamA family transporter n=1 Tax=Oscillatoria sp. FACHB-1407 TaxID=2692847 RepID=UPI001685206E|nr:EamA family transporter [Oscillatoria sp. FACHB-1407]MBD2459505.1 EamA family transporter [Oscillatoria sp. FACHB-1407]
MTRTHQYRNAFGFAAIALAATLWAIAAIVASQLFAAGVTPLQLAMARAVIAAIGLGAINHWTGQSRHWRDWRIVILGLSLALVTLAYYIAIERLSVAVAVVIQYTAPALIVILSAARLGRLPSWATSIAAAIALLGVVFVSGLGTDELRVDAVGLIAAGLSAIFFASYTLFSEALVDRYGAIGVMFRGFVVSSLLWLMIQLPQGMPSEIFQAQTLPGIVFVGIGGTLIPFSLLCWGIQQVRAERGAIAATLEPVMAAGLAWFALGQALTPLQLMGSLLVIIAVTLLQIQKGDRSPQPGI